MSNRQFGGRIGGGIIPDVCVSSDFVEDRSKTLPMSLFYEIILPRNNISW
jgi:hypothetical protein